MRRQDAIGRALLGAALAVLLSVPAGCAEPGSFEAQAPFTCTVATCPDGSCKLHLQFHLSCTDEMDQAEIVLNEALEPAFATVGTVFDSAGDVPVGNDGIFWVRSDTWAWGEISFRCNSPQNDGHFTLSCCTDENACTNPHCECLEE